ncbi:MAG: hypothetical protein IKT55_08545 [Clostridia bacterium]|nr:hypothetical protein [Clostridia bacterium]
MISPKEVKYLPNDIFCPAIQEMLSEGMDVEFTITGNSMWPLLKHERDTITLTLCNGENVKKGDIILFEALPSKYLLHRATGVSKSSFESTGDRNTFRDGTFPKACIIGKAVKITRKGKSRKTKSPLIRLYSFFWMNTYPLRKPILMALNLISKFKN